jgi:hypothetical protein
MQLKYFKLIYLKLKIHIMSIIGRKYSYDRYDTKWNRIKKFAIYFNNDADFVETGTYYGLTVDFCKKYFKKIYSIELNHELFEFNKKRFSSYNKIELLEGDSGELLNTLLSNKTLSANCVFWLDGHYSDKETSISSKTSPIIEELTDIFKFRTTQNNWIILIDDKRLFDGIDYPRLDLVENLAINNKYKFDFDNDCIVLQPNI